MAPDILDVGLPEKLEVHEDGLGLVITRRWFGVSTVLITAFAAVWDGFLFFWYRHVPASAPSFFFWLPLLHVGVDVFITYGALAGWVNRTRIRVARDLLRVTTRPLPFFNDRTVPSSSLKQLYAKERIRSGGEGGSSASYEVHAILRDGRNMKLVSGLESSEQALFLERKIEKYLGIENLPVRGEL